MWRLGGLWALVFGYRRGMEDNVINRRAEGTATRSCRENEKAEKASCLVEEVVAEVSALGVDAVGLDDMDNLVKSSDASEYENVYRRVKEMCRFLKIPVFVLAQPNRVAKQSTSERFLGRYDIAWSGSAENSAALQIALPATVSIRGRRQKLPNPGAQVSRPAARPIARTGWLPETRAWPAPARKSRRWPPHR